LSGVSGADGVEVAAGAEGVSAVTSFGRLQIVWVLVPRWRSSRHCSSSKTTLALVQPARTRMVSPIAIHSRTHSSLVIAF
jgi:hypothetical protein